MMSQKKNPRKGEVLKGFEVLQKSNLQTHTVALALSKGTYLCWHSSLVALKQPPEYVAFPNTSRNKKVAKVFEIFIELDISNTF